MASVALGSTTSSEADCLVSVLEERDTGHTRLEPNGRELAVRKPRFSVKRRFFSRINMTLKVRVESN